MYGHRHVMFTSDVHSEGVGLTALTAALAALALTSGTSFDGRYVSALERVLASDRAPIAAAI
jgi:hypothetical protein